MSAENTKDTVPAKVEVSYRVTVTKIVRNFPFRNRAYETIGTKVGDDGEEEKDYGYVYFDDTKDVETPVYRQELDTVDLPNVIKAVNGMDNHVTQ